MTQLAIFDYNSLTPDVRDFLMTKEKTIKYRMATSIIDTGRDLMEAKEKCGHGTFLSWVNYAFGMSKERAAEYMRVSKEFDGIDSDLLEQFGKSALVMLSSRSMPAEIKEKALDLASSGEKVTIETVKKLKSEIQEYEQVIDELNHDLENSNLAIQNLKTEVIHLQVSKPEKIVEIVEKEVVVEVVPADYDAAKKQAASVLKELDFLRSQVDDERQHSDKLRKKISVEGSLSKLSAGLELIRGVLARCDVTVDDVPVSLQRDISECDVYLREIVCTSFIPVDTNKSGRDKLLRAGFVLIRPDESSFSIKKYDGNGIWSKYSDYESRSQFRDALKSFADDEKVILA